MGISLAAPVRQAVDTQARLLLAWNRAINLTALREPAQVAVGHVADSLSALRLLDAVPKGSLLDIGSGAGYPGLPLGLALGVRRLGLVESVGKKARFLETVARAVGEELAAAGAAAPTIEVHPDRAERLAGAAGQETGWEIVTARAVASLPRLAELALPLVAPGGLLVAWKRDDGAGALEREIEAASAAIVAAGGRLEGLRVVAAELPELGDHRLVIVPRAASG
jgi:16S rRNA (guanine527-N7)-methyltransferase